MNEEGQEIKERCFNFSLRVIDFIDLLPKTTATLIITRQLVRSATSIGANLVEGSDACSKKEFINYLNISRKSARETIYWLEMIKHKKWVGEKETEILIKEATEIRKIISTIIINTKKNYKF